MAANATIGSLRVVLGLDSAQFETGMKRAKQGLKDFDATKGLKSLLGDFNRGLNDTSAQAGLFGKALSSMGAAGLVAGAAIGGVAIAVGAARQAFAFADEISDTANKLAISTKGLQEYRFAIHQLGGDYKDADAALEGFSRAFGAAHGGLSAKAVKPFKALGLDPADFKSTESALQAVIDKVRADVA